MFFENHLQQFQQNSRQGFFQTFVIPSHFFSENFPKGFLNHPGKKFSQSLFHKIIEKFH